MKGYKTKFFSLMLMLSGLAFGVGIIDADIFTALATIFGGGMGLGFRDAIK